MNMLKKCLALVLMMILLPVWSCFASDSVFIRIDRDDPAAWEKELDNVRFLQDEGMSGSAQFSENQFRSLAADLRQRSGDVYIVDCRLESHGFINGIAVSWCGVNNGANLGKTVEEVEADEKGYLSGGRRAHPHMHALRLCGNAVHRKAEAQLGQLADHH